jgi:hypothetical protein
MHFSARTGWFVIGDMSAGGSIEAVEFATDTVAVVSDSTLLALWIKPENWHEVAPRLKQ